MSAHLFDASSRDVRDLDLSSRVSDGIVQYYLQLTLNDFRRDDATLRDKSEQFSLKHVNLRIKDGYGIRADGLDRDRELKDGAWTNSKRRVALAHRFFTAAPSLSKARGDSDAELRLQTGGEDTSLLLASKKNVTEMNFDRFVPGVHEARDMNTPFVWGGASSRDIVRSRQLACGRNTRPHMSDEDVDKLRWGLSTIEGDD